MRLPIPIVSNLLLICLFPAAANKAEDEQKKLKILQEHHLVTMEISSASKEQFSQYMAGFCMTDMTPSDYLNNYIQWEQVEFLDSVKAFLDPTNSENGPKSYFHHLGHNFATNCSIKDDKYIRDAHNEISQQALFDNYMYDQMTRYEWTQIHL